MANRWRNSGNSGRLYFGGSKITADGDCSHEIKTLAPWKRSYDQPRQHITKQRCYFTDKCLSHQNNGSSSSHVWMWALDYKENWAPKNWCFWTWTVRTSSKSILKEISPEYSLERLMLKLKLQYFGHLMQRTDSLEKTLILGKIEGRKRKGQERIRWLDGITDSMDMSVWKLRESVMDRDTLHAAVHEITVRHRWVTELDWTEQEREW